LAPNESPTKQAQALPARRISSVLYVPRIWMQLLAHICRTAEAVLSKHLDSKLLGAIATFQPML
jgi:hypothetical protein